MAFWVVFYGFLAILAGWRFTCWLSDQNAESKAVTLEDKRACVLRRLEWSYGGNANAERLARIHLSGLEHMESFRRQACAQRDKPLRQLAKEYANRHTKMLIDICGPTEDALHDARAVELAVCGMPSYEVYIYDETPRGDVSEHVINAAFEARTRL